MSDILQVTINGLLMGSVFSLIAVALNVLFGVMEIVNFAHGSLVMLGMYFAYWLSILFHINPYFAIFIGIPLFFLIGMGIQKNADRSGSQCPTHQPIPAHSGLNVVS